jgi:hypothetical protein
MASQTSNIQTQHYHIVAASDAASHDDEFKLKAMTVARPNISVKLCSNRKCAIPVLAVVEPTPVIRKNCSNHGVSFAVVVVRPCHPLVTRVFTNTPSRL